ncbi:MAG: hypothetical protein PHD53_06270, partial [Methylococcales bacterium]|nr:hypothetical protein [Methylococcales bacterium]
AGPVPRTGGIALMAGIMSGWVLLFSFWAWWIVLPVLGLFVLSLVGDVRGLPQRVRLAGHFIAALIVLSCVCQRIKSPCFVVSKASAICCDNCSAQLSTLASRKAWYKSE